MNKLEIGKPYVPGIRKWPEGIEYNYRDDTHQLRIFYPTVARDEVSSVRTGAAEFALVVAGDIILLLFKFESALGWSDAPYSWHLVSAENRTLPELDAEQSPMLLISLIGADNGILEALRVISFPTEFTEKLNAAIRQQAKRPISRASYDRQLNELFRRYRTQDLLPRAIARFRTTGGLGPALILSFGNN